jgi:DNA topoisomerase-1
MSNIETSDTAMPTDAIQPEVDAAVLDTLALDEDAADGSAGDDDEWQIEARARSLGLHIVDPGSLEIRRARRGTGFSYHLPDGARVSDPETLKRIRSLAIPPAYREVFIASDPMAHVQAVGRDDKGRLQYRYHPEWQAVREQVKADHLAHLIDSLPRIRRAVDRDLADRNLTRRKALAAAVGLIDASAIRVGGEAYLGSSGNRGAATLLKRDATIRGNRIRLTFTGKGGKEVDCVVENGRLARALARIAKLPGRRLLQYRIPGGGVRRITATEVNTYLRQIAGRPVSAKDLRLLSASVAAAGELIGMEPEPSERRRRKQLATMMVHVSEHLANTPAVVRKSYVHQLVLDGFLDGSLKESYRVSRTGPARDRLENTLHKLIRDRGAAL